MLLFVMVSLSNMELFFYASSCSTNLFLPGLLIILLDLIPGLSGQTVPGDAERKQNIREQHQNSIHVTFDTQYSFLPHIILTWRH